MNKMRKSSKTVGNLIVSFILMLTLMCISIFAMGKYSMLSVRAVMHSCERIEYYEDINVEMTTLAYEKGIPYGIKKKYVKNAFDDKQIEKDMEQVFLAQVNGEEHLVDTGYIRENITEKVLEDYGTLTEEQQKSLDAYLVEVSNMYKDKMVIAGSNYFAPLIELWTKIITVGIPVCILLASICIFILLSSRKMIYRGLRYVAYSILAAGVTLTTVFSASISNGFIYKFNISDVYMRKFYTYWIGHEMLMQVFVGIGMLLTGGVLIYIIYRQKFKYR